LGINYGNTRKNIDKIDIILSGAGEALFKAEQNGRIE